MSLLYTRYSEQLCHTLSQFDWSHLTSLAQQLGTIRTQKRRVFLCGNGGSAANAIHIANDLLYAPGDKAIRATALTANIAVVTCIANDIDYRDIFAKQLEAHGDAGDLLIALSGSGNSDNIVRAIKQAKNIGMTSYAIVGFDGGTCKQAADHSLHFPVHDMQIAEDIQTIVGHMLMKALNTP